LGEIEVSIGEGTARTGLLNAQGEELVTPIWGYGQDDDHTWPGKTFEVQSDDPLRVHWVNNLPIEKGYLLTGKNNSIQGYPDYEGKSVVDTSYHWAFSIPGYEEYSIETHGTPIVPHLHG